MQKTNYERYRPWRCLALFSVSSSFSDSSPPLCCFAEDEARQLSSAARCHLIGCFLQVRLLCLLSFSSVCVCVCVCVLGEIERARARPPAERASEPAHDCVCAKECTSTCIRAHPFVQNRHRRTPACTHIPFFSRTAHPYARARAPCAFLRFSSRSPFPHRPPAAALFCS